jgi:hypothetical protein
VAVLVLAAAVTCWAAQDPPGEVLGRVTENGGAPVAGVVVTLSGPGLPAPKTATTDASGTYHLSVPAGTYTVSFKVGGFFPFSQDGIAVRADGQKIISVELAANGDKRADVKLVTAPPGASAPTAGSAGSSPAPVNPAPPAPVVSAPAQPPPSAPPAVATPASAPPAASRGVGEAPRPSGAAGASPGVAATGKPPAPLVSHVAAPVRDALLSYLQGDVAHAIALLEPSANDRTSAPQLRAEIHAYLGVAYANRALVATTDQKQWQQKADDQFRLALEAEPAYQLSARLVSPKIQAMLEAIRVKR